ncbi:MAG TPA: hypothetical protein VIH27_01225 [Nitrososphaerales archaeon]
MTNEWEKLMKFEGAARSSLFQLQIDLINAIKILAGQGFTSIDCVTVLEICRKNTDTYAKEINQ